jgi:hypothetical protein
MGRILHPRICAIPHLAQALCSPIRGWWHFVGSREYNNIYVIYTASDAAACSRDCQDVPFRSISLVKRRPEPASALLGLGCQYRPAS